MSIYVNDFLTFNFRVLVVESYTHPWGRSLCIHVYGLG